MVKNKSLKIAQIAPMSERVPPKKYGGTERVIYFLTEELIKRGHQVTLFASGDSKTSAQLLSVYPRALRESRIREVYGLNDLVLLNIGNAYTRQKEFDIIHDHNGTISLPAAQFSQTPVIITLHGPFTITNRRLYETLNKPNLVSISKAQAKDGKKANIIANVYNGLEMADYPFSLESEGYLVFVGRISAEKGVHNAIEVALYLNLSLIIAAKLEAVDIPYFNEYIGPRLSDQVQWIGEVSEDERNILLSKALAFLHPATWKEPFGLTLIESMACGCPVVAFNKGSIPEIIEDGKSGYVVSDIDEMIEAVEKIDQIDRNYCRNYALDNFNAQKMADGYEAIYRQILDSQR